jgi:ribosome-binding protein aMBF1 (putative translation factor)
MNISIQHIGQFENGKMAPSNAMIAKLERLLNVKLPRNKK